LAVAELGAGAHRTLWKTAPPSIGHAAAANRLNSKRSKSRAIVLLTDGENNAGKIREYRAEALKALHIHFYAIGAGINGIARSRFFTPKGPLTDWRATFSTKTSQSHS